MAARQKYVYTFKLPIRFIRLNFLSVRKQIELNNDLHSEGEFWKTRDQRDYDSRTTGVEMKPVSAD